MAKTIIIPSAIGSRITVTVNGVDYTYATGSEVTVPDEVAEVIERMIAQPETKRETAVNEMLADIISRVDSLEKGGNRFIVNLTPDAEDLSGQMDKTVGEIYNAYLEGKELIFHVHDSEESYMELEVSAKYFNENAEYPSFNGYVITESTIVYAFTGTTNDPDENTYSTIVSLLTPMT